MMHYKNAWSSALKFPLFIFTFGFMLNQAVAQAIPSPNAESGCSIPVNERKRIDIQEVTLVDSVLLEEIGKMIAEEAEQSEMFRKGYGYITVFPSALLPSQATLQKNLIRSYYITVDYTGLKNPKQDEQAYLSDPTYYSFVGNRLVFIKFNMLEGGICYSFTNRSMQRLRKIQSDFLEEPKKVAIYNLEGEKIGIDKNF